MISRCGKLLPCTQRVPVAVGASKSGNTFFSSETFPYSRGGTLSGTTETRGSVRPWTSRGFGFRGARTSALPGGPRRTARALKVSLNSPVYSFRSTFPRPPSAWGGRPVTCLSRSLLLLQVRALTSGRLRGVRICLWVRS